MEIIQFWQEDRRRTVMSQHSASLEIERPRSAAEVQRLAPLPEPVVPASAASTSIRGKLRRIAFAGLAIAALSGAAWYGWDYWTVGRFLVSTDDAYVKADNTTIAPKVSGYLSRVLVGDNQPVKAGQVLARIDDRDFKVALDQAKADVAAAEAAVASKH